METIIFLLFVGWCVTTTIINGDIFDPIRNYTLVRFPKIAKLFTCVRCLGFWIGFIGFGSLTISGIMGDVVAGVPPFFNLVVLPFVQSGSCVLLESLIVFLHKQTSVNINTGKSDDL
jgi:hypothetical protein